MTRIVEAENWKSIPGYWAYMASTLGRIKRVLTLKKTKRYYKNGMWLQEKILKPVPSRNKKYLSVALQKEFNDYNVSKVPVHKLVALAFYGTRPIGLECCHNDGNPQNNRPDNIRYDTHKSNCFDRKTHGTERRPCVKLKSKEVSLIKKLLKNGIDRSLITKMFKVTYQNVNLIKNNITWKTVLSY